MSDDTASLNNMSEHSLHYRNGSLTAVSLAKLSQVLCYPAHRWISKLDKSGRDDLATAVNEVLISRIGYTGPPSRQLNLGIGAHISGDSTGTYCRRGIGGRIL
jgi:hypothetical protein